MEYLQCVRGILFDLAYVLKIVALIFLEEDISIYTSIHQEYTIHHW